MQSPPHAPTAAPRRSLAARLCTLAAAPLALARCACTDPDCVVITDKVAGEAPIEARVVVDGLEVPWSIAFLPEGEPAQLLVTERAGRLRAVRDGALVDEPLATLDVLAEGEGGLLGLAVDPDFADTRAIYLYGTFDDENRVERWLLNDDVSAATRDRVILDGIPRGRVHDGGRLRFAPDDTLFVSTGETGEPALARDDDSLAGKLLRITRDGDVPDGNPRASPIYVKGIRNAQGFDFKDGIDTIVIADHGPSGEDDRHGHDELNVAQPGDDLGWPDIYACEARDGLVAPRVTWQVSLPPGGIQIVRGEAVPAWRGKVLVAALRARQLEVVDLDKSPATTESYLDGDVGSDDGFGRLRDVVEAPDGRLFVTTSNCDGRGTCPETGDRILEISAR